MTPKSQISAFAALKSAGRPQSIADLVASMKWPRFMIVESMADLKKAGYVKETHDNGYPEYSCLKKSWADFGAVQPTKRR